MYTPQEVAGWFTHTPGGAIDFDKARRFKRLHDAARAFAAELVAVLPPDRHESVISLDRLQESVTWANSAISREGFASGVPAVCAGCGMLADECLKTAACDLAGRGMLLEDGALPVPVSNPIGTPVAKKKDSESSSGGSEA